MLVFGADAAVAHWVAQRIADVGADGFGPCRAIGVERANLLVAGVVYHDYQGDTVQLSIAADTPRWATRETVAAMLRYPFAQLGVAKAWAASRASNVRAIRFNLGIGMTKEATLREHRGGEDVVICGMLRREWKERWSDG